MKYPIDGRSPQTLKRDRFTFWTIILVLAFIFALIFIVYPFSNLLIQSFTKKNIEGFTLQNYLRFFEKKYYRAALMNSLKICSLTTLLATALGVPLAYIATRYNIHLKKSINLLIILSWLSPPFIGAYSWIVLLGRAGFLTKILNGIGIQIGSIYGFGGMMLVFTLKLFPIVFMYVSNALKSIDASLEEASESLGSSKMKRLFTVTFPVILPTILSSALMVFMTSLADFGTPRLIGEGYKTLPVVIYEEFMSETGSDAGFASMLSVVIVLVALAILVVQKLFIDSKSYNMNGLNPPAVQPLSGWKRMTASVSVFFFAFLAVLPQITVMTTSFLKTNGPAFLAEFSLDNYRAVISKMGTNIRNTFLFSFIAIAVIVLLAMLVAYLVVRRKSKATATLDLLMMAPYVIPGSVIGISLIIAFNSGNIILTGTAMILIVSYIIRKMPYTLRSSIGILYQMDPSIEEASISLGASPMKTFYKITARIMLGGVLSGAVLSFVSTINELSSTVMLYTGKTATISVAIYGEIFKNGYGNAAALSSILTLTTIICLALFNKLTDGKGMGA